MGKKQQRKKTCQLPLVVRNVKYSYKDGKYNLTCVDFISELEAPFMDYDAIVAAIKEMHPDYTEIKVMSFQHS